MVIDMNDGRIGTLDQLRRFLDGTLDVQFAPASDAASRYGHIAPVVRRFGYAHRPHADKQVVLSYLGATGGYGPAQVKRLVARAMAGQTPDNFWNGFLSGLAHPIIGLDHLAFVVASGLIAVGMEQGLLIPLAFAIATYSLI